MQEKSSRWKLWFVKVRDSSCALSFGLVSQAWNDLSEKSSERILALYQGASASITNSFKVISETR